MGRSRTWVTVMAKPLSEREQQGLARGAFVPSALNAGAANGGSARGRAFRSFVMPAQLHLAVDAFALQLLLSAQLVDIIVAAMICIKAANSFWDRHLAG